MDDDVRVVTFDVETTIDAVYGPAPQYYPNNKAVHTGILIEDKAGGENYIVSRINNPLYYSPHIIQGHNLKFDLLYMENEYPGLLKFLALSGVILWDTQLVHYLMTAQQSKTISLDELSEYYGLPLKDDLIKDYFKLGIGADQIDPTEILPYLRQDVCNTHEIGKFQRGSLNIAGMTNLVITQGDALLAITEMEKNGLQIDTALLNQMWKENDKFLAAVTADLAATLFAWYSDLTPEDVNLNSPQFLSAILFGGTLKVKRRRTVVDDNLKVVRYKSGKQKGLPKTKIYQDELKFKGMFDGDKLSEKTSSGSQYQVNEDVIKRLLDNCVPTSSMNIFLRQLLQYKSTSKEQSTYIEGIQDIMFPDGRVYGSINQTVTTTGRTSSSKPNLQNITSKDDSDVKKLFISRYVDKGYIVEVDYKQLEVIALALVSGDEQLIDDIKMGRDIHNETGKKVFSLPMSHDVRRQVKGVNFGIIYGGSAKTLAKQAGVDVEVAKQLIAAFYNRYPGVYQWQENYREAVESQPTTLEGTTATGKPRHMATMTTDTGRLLAFKEYDNFWGSKLIFSPTEMKNYPVQALATGDIVPLMVGVLFKEICKAGLYEDVHLVNTVHDSIILDVHETKLKETTKLCKNVLEQVPKYLEDLFGIETDLPFKVEITAGRNWKEQKELDKLD